MSFLDSFSSKKGAAGKEKAGKGVRAAVKADEAKKEAFAQVSDGKKETKVTAPKPGKESTVDAYRILTAPIVTEKSALLAKQSQYIFLVTPRATKMDVRNAVHQVYGVRPVAVNIVSLPGKHVRFGRHFGQQVSRKKAVVTLPAGKTIDVTNA